MDKELIRVENLKKYYDIKGGIITHTVSQIQAVDGIDFSVKKRARPLDWLENQAVESPRSASFWWDCSRRLTVRFIIMGKK